LAHSSATNPCPLLLLLPLLLPHNYCCCADLSRACEALARSAAAEQQLVQQLKAAAREADSLRGQLQVRVLLLVNVTNNMV
jgi:hypothetical protein